MRKGFKINKNWPLEKSNIKFVYTISPLNTFIIQDYRFTWLNKEVMQVIKYFIYYKIINNIIKIINNLIYNTSKFIYQK